MGNDHYARCMVFHSLSKRSNLPGLRSGFVAGDANIISDFLKYRTYHGCAMSAHHQHVSELAWQDESHVINNRHLYQKKFATVEDILKPVYDIRRPEGGFYHWLPTPIDDQSFACGVLEKFNLTVMPGSFLSRQTPGTHADANPGLRHVRLAWVAELENCIEAAHRLVEYAGIIRQTYS